MIDWTKLHVSLCINFLSTQIVFIVCISDEFVNELKERFDERDVKHIISNINILMFDIAMKKLLLLFQDFQWENFDPACFIQGNVGL